MRSRHLVAMLALAVARPAAADSPKLLVLQSDGRADAATRAKIDAAIVKLAIASDPQAAAGDLTYGDAATAVGCKPETPACKDEVLGMLAVDEIVITTVTPRPGGLEIAVRRVAKAGPSRDATMLLATGAPPDKLDAIAALFGAEPAAVATRPTPPPPRDPPVIPSPATPPPAAQRPAPSPVAAPAAPARSGPEPIEPPGSGNHRLEMIGMVGGAGLTVVGVILWGAASSTQGDINSAPTATKQNLIDLKNLESRGDAYAGVGNVLVIGGLIVGGLATYFYIKDRGAAAATSTARLWPTVLDHGAGLVLTLGGTP